MYELTCKSQVDCERLGVGCIKNNNNKTISTKCCSTDLCNNSTTHIGNQSAVVMIFIDFDYFSSSLDVHCMEKKVELK